MHDSVLSENRRVDRAAFGSSCKEFSPLTVAGYEWEDVLPTLSSVQSVSSLLRGCKAQGVTFMVPRAD